jgi:hypothetical protein
MRRASPLAAALLLAAALPARAEDFKVVVHPENPAVELDPAALSQLFLRRTVRWPDGTRVEPVEPASEALQARFAADVHGKRLAAVKAFWNQQIFSGRDVPPVEKTSDAEVVAWVRAHRGGVGYVSAGADVTGVRAVHVGRR